MKSSKLLLIILFFGNIALADTATVFDPVSLIRIKPDGKILCRVKEVKEIKVLHFNDDWYSTNACGSMGVIHKSQIKFTTEENTPESFKYDAAGLFHHGSAPVKVGKFWGLINVNEKWLVSPEYEDIGRYNEGVMAVKQNEKFAFIDSKGERITNFSYDAAHYFSNDFAGVKLGNKWGYINKKGKLLIPARYDAVREFKEGFTPVRIDKKWGFINKQGKWLVKPIYDAAYNFSDGVAVVVVKNKRGFISKKGRFKIKPSYRRVLRFSEGLAPVSMKNEQWYFVDEQNKQLFNKTYSKVRTFSEGMAAVMNNENKWGYIDKNGIIKIQYQYDKAYDFKDGFALVRKNNKRGFINLKGKVVVPLKYDDAYQFSEDFAPVKIGIKWGYLKKNHESTLNSPKISNKEKNQEDEIKERLIKNSEMLKESISVLKEDKICQKKKSEIINVFTSSDNFANITMNKLLDTKERGYQRFYDSFMHIKLMLAGSINDLESCIHIVELINTKSEASNTTIDRVSEAFALFDKALKAANKPTTYLNFLIKDLKLFEVSLEENKKIEKNSKKFIDNGDGTIAETNRKLIWKKCIEGLSGTNCKGGKQQRYNWQAAKNHVKTINYAGFSDWRLPTIEELSGLIYCSNGGADVRKINIEDKAHRKCDGRVGKDYKSPTINQIIFPKSHGRIVWSSTEYNNFAGAANFTHGYLYRRRKSNRNRFYVRLVRDDN